MPQQTKPYRLLTLMERVGWNGWTNWTLLEERVSSQHVIPFKKWLKENIPFCPTEEVRGALVDYYFEGTSIKGSRWYQYKDMGVEALAALYAKEQSDVRRDSNANAR